MRVIPAVRFGTGHEARVRSNCGAGAHEAKSFVGFMTAAFGKDLADDRNGSESHLDLLKDIEMKIDELKQLEKRLGTSAETPPDLERARELAHRINNLLTTYRLGGDLNARGAG